MKQELINRLHETAGATLDITQAKLEAVCENLVWSERMTSTAGRAFHDSGTIKLSLPIHVQAIRDGGIGYAEDQVRDTVLHELAHLYVGPGHGHDARWRDMCRRIGAKPTRCHEMRTEAQVARDIDPRDVVSPQLFPIGAEFEFEHKGEMKFGIISKHNRKTFSAIVDGQPGWRFYWRWAAENVTVY